MKRSMFLRAAAVAVALGCAWTAQAQDARPIKVGFVTFLSGPPAGAFGVPARNGAEITVEAINAGSVPAPYTTKGYGGAPIELVFVDEAGGTTKQVTELRNLVQRQNVDVVIGYISSGDCLAVAPVAEELKKLTVLFDCGTPRIFEDASYRYVFRTGATGTMDNVAAALYVTEMKPQAKRIAGINQNYAWGQDSWNDFELAMKALRPGTEIVTSQMPKLFAGQFGAEISTLLNANADILHSSFWGADLEGLVLQGAPRGLFGKGTVILSAGEPAIPRLGVKIPDGTVIGARGPYGPFAPDTALAKWFKQTYADRYGIEPIYAAYKAAQALMGVKAAWEKAQAANGGKTPTQDQVIAAFEFLEFEGPGGKVSMKLGKGHQAVMDNAIGTTKVVDGKLTITNIKHYPADKINPPEGVKSEVWLKSGFKGK